MLLDDLSEIGTKAAQWRRDFHQHPEVLYDLERTAKKVAELLTSFGCDEVATGIGQTGVVGVIRGKGDGKAVGFRADMDALPISEETNLPYRSTHAGKMHACGHDGHMAMLLGAARRLCETRDFSGTVVVIFQPAEEGGAGARAMIEDGLFERFPVDSVYGLHNQPGMAVGTFGIVSGPIMAAADQFTIEIEGRGGHAAQPHRTIDPVLVASHLVTALQSIVSRNVDPLQSAVLSVTKLIAGETYNVIPQTALLAGTVRTLSMDVAKDTAARIHQVAEHVAAAFGAKASVGYRYGYPVTVNHPAQTKIAAETAGEIGKLDHMTEPMMGAEDFSFMLEKRPGAYIFMGNGDTAGLHHPAYDFNDDALAHGIAYWTKLAQAATRA